MNGYKAHMAQYSQMLDTVLTTNECKFSSVINTRLPNETNEVKMEFLTE